ncbi:MAG: hypothetical protein V4539_15500 [Bacteroidota bacterium]
MKKVLRYIPLLLVVLFAQSCMKTTVVPNDAPVTGSWVLTETKQSTGNGWYYFNSGLEAGVFDFYNDGAAQYDDGHAVMTGNWSLRTISSGYYDEYGNYYSDLHDSFEIHVYDSYTHSSADLYFDDVRFTGNKIIATNYYGGVISKYVFSRY